MIVELIASAPATGGSGSQGSPWLIFVIAPVFIIFGIALAVHPKLQWKMNRWAYKNPEAMEPSAKGLIAARITGLAMVVIATVTIVVAATKT